MGGTCPEVCCDIDGSCNSSVVISIGVWADVFPVKDVPESTAGPPVLISVDAKSFLVVDCGTKVCSDVKSPPG